MRAHRIDHRGRPAEIDVDIAAVEIVGTEMVGDMARAHMSAFWIGAGGDETEAGDPRGERLDPLHLNQVIRLMGAIEQAPAMAARAILRELFEIGRANVRTPVTNA